ncbi:MAG: hypothetical protein CVU17_11010 [Betaproteobacteria bacterium HGW-Betaproteobacteria-11]|nr:MAG: hypothetical protein CVU17_11010 [Betaproteobacteria bacterium HGW-Betaproteobacteria-11]
MHTFLKWALAIGAALGSLPALAADADLEALRADLAQMKAVYEQRIAALEQRLAQREAKAAAADSGQAALAPASEGSAPAAANAFNPEISLILSGMYTNTARDARQDPTGVAGRERRPQGVLPSGLVSGVEARSWNLGESELALSSMIDPLFRGNLLLSIAPDDTVGVEEAQIQTLGLGHGLTVKAGRFFSGIGYANEQHAHVWDFSDAALPYQAFFGPQLGYDGVQVKWLAPTDLFLELGAESGRARGFPATDHAASKNGFLSGSLFAHLGGDLGVSGSWRGGLSYFQAKPRNRVYDDVDSAGNQVTNAFSGKSRTLVADFVWKWAPQGNPQVNNFTLQGEWFRRREEGALAFDTTGITPAANLTGDFRSAQSGFYVQGIWQFRPAWRVGYRYDQLSSPSISNGLIESGALTAADLPILSAYRPQRQTAMVDWSPSEFSRIRFQVARDQTRPEVTDNQLWLHYIMSLGTHGAHKF